MRAEIQKNIQSLRKEIPNNVTLVCVSKTKPFEFIEYAYLIGERNFGENKVQELAPKYESLPKDIKWHFIGHLQRNKVKYIANFVHLIHSVDSLRLLNEINKQGEKINRAIPCLLQIHIANEETKFGLDRSELIDVLEKHLTTFEFVEIHGLMGMATNSDDQNIVRQEFKYLKSLFDDCGRFKNGKHPFNMLSMGMSNDYNIAIEEGSTMIRLGSTIFGARNYE